MVNFFTLHWQQRKYDFFDSRSHTKGVAAETAQRNITRIYFPWALYQEVSAWEWEGERGRSIFSALSSSSAAGLSISGVMDATAEAITARWKMSLSLYFVCPCEVGSRADSRPGHRRVLHAERGPIDCEHVRRAQGDGNKLLQHSGGGGGRCSRPRRLPRGTAATVKYGSARVVLKNHPLQMAKF